MKITLPSDEIFKAKEKLIETLIDWWKNEEKHPEVIEFTKDSEANKLLNDINNYPHAFVLGAIMDRQISAERAWKIPYEISREIGSFEFDKLKILTEWEIKKIFEKKNLHRFNEKMAGLFYKGIKTIERKYHGDAAAIWKGTPRSTTVVRRFLEFEGVGRKIASMATNILARDFKIPMKDYRDIDISTDRHVKRVFIRMGFIEKGTKNDELIFIAREIYPDYPGILDAPAFRIGRDFCKERKPLCAKCPLKDFCPKLIEEKGGNDGNN